MGQTSTEYDNEVQRLIKNQEYRNDKELSFFLFEFIAYMFFSSDYLGQTSAIWQKTVLIRKTNYIQILVI